MAVIILEVFMAQIIMEGNKLFNEEQEAKMKLLAEKIKEAEKEIEELQKANDKITQQIKCKR